MMAKPNVLYLAQSTTVRSKELGTHNCHNVNKSEKHAEGQRPDQKEHIHYTILFQ